MILKKILEAHRAKKAEEKGKKVGQITLNSIVAKVQAPTAFLWEGILDAVTCHIVCSN